MAVYPTLDHYSIDCFALETEQSYGGMRVFDYGVGFK
jgi:hypothetical protein